MRKQRRFPLSRAVLLLLVALLSGLDPLLAQGIKATPRPAPAGDLILSTKDGAVPLTVKILGPKFLLDRLQSVEQGKDPNPFTWSQVSVDWGDGTVWPKQEQPVEGGLTTHTYLKPGKYVVTAFTNRYDGMDHLIVEWKRRVTINVTGGKGAPAVAPVEDSLSVLFPTAANVFKFEELPPVRLSFRANQRVSFALSLVDESNETVIPAEESSPTSVFSGTVVLKIPTREPAMLQRAVADGKKRFKVRTVMHSTSGKVLATADSQAFALTPQLKETAMSVKRSKSNPMEVVVSYLVYDPKCFSYILDWGDGTSPQRDVKPQKDLAYCKTAEGTRTFAHTYAEPGKYTIKMKSNANDVFTDVEATPFFEAIDIAVPSK